MEKRRVSIVIPTYSDDPEHLAEAVASAQAQTYGDVEVVVVDDGSEVPVKLDGVRVIRQDNAGVATARNTGIRETTGDVVICLDADDRLSPDYAEQAVAVLTDPDVSIAYPVVCRFGLDTGVWADTGERFTLHDFVQRSRVTAASAFRRAAWEAVGGYDESEELRPGHEDHEFWIRLLSKTGGQAVAMPSAALHYRIREGSAFRSIPLARAEAITRARILANNTPETHAVLLAASWAHSDAVEKDLERARRNRVKDAVWKVRRAVSARR